MTSDIQKVLTDVTLGTFLRNQDKYKARITFLWSPPNTHFYITYRNRLQNAASSHFKGYRKRLTSIVVYPEMNFFLFIHLIPNQWLTFFTQSIFKNVQAYVFHSFKAYSEHMKLPKGQKSTIKALHSIWVIWSHTTDQHLNHHSLKIFFSAVALKSHLDIIILTLFITFGYETDQWYFTSSLYQHIFM